MSTAIGLINTNAHAVNVTLLLRLASGQQSIGSFGLDPRTSRVDALEAFAAAARGQRGVVELIADGDVAISATRSARGALTALPVVDPSR
jgi:hypothetical protein